MDIFSISWGSWGSLGILLCTHTGKSIEIYYPVWKYVTKNTIKKIVNISKGSSQEYDIYSSCSKSAEPCYAGLSVLREHPSNTIKALHQIQATINSYYNVQWCCVMGCSSLVFIARKSWNNSYCFALLGSEFYFCFGRFNTTFLENCCSFSLSLWTLWLGAKARLEKFTIG